MRVFQFNFFATELRLKGYFFSFFYENKNTMTQPLFTYYCGNNREKIHLFKSCCAHVKGNLLHIMNCKK